METSYVTDSKGRTTAAIVPIADYKRLLEIAEEFKDIEEYDLAKSLDEESIPLSEAITMIELIRAANGQI